MPGLHTDRPVVSKSSANGWRRLATVTAAAIAVSTGTAAAAAPASASDPSVTWAFSQFLTGSVGALDLSGLPGVAGVGASYPTLPSPAALPIDTATLNGLTTSLGGGLPLFGPTGVLELGSGAVNQVAGAPASGDLSAATGAVTDAGVPDLGGLGTPTTLDATGLLSRVPAVGAALSQLTVTLDGIAATATQAAGGSPVGSSALSGGVLTMASPILAGIPASVLSALGPVQTALDGLGGQSGGLATALSGIGVVDQVLSLLGLPATNTVTVGDPNLLLSTVTPLLSQTLTSPDGFLGLDLGTGTITADLAGLLGGDLGNLPVGTDVLSPAIVATISDDVSSVVQTLVSDIQDAVTTAIGSAPVSLTSTAGVLTGVLPTGLDITTNGTVDQILAGTAPADSVLILAGLPLALPDADLLSALSAPINTGVLDGALPGLDTALLGQVTDPTTSTLAPALDAVGSVLSMTANAQSALNGVFTQTALLTTLLPGGDPLAVLGLGSASVGTLPAVAPTATSLTPTRGPAAGGKQVTVTGTNFVPGFTTVHIGGKTVPAGAVSVAPTTTSLSFTTPNHAAGNVPVTVQTTVGTSGTLSYRYLPVPRAAALHPNSGPATGARPLTITGAGFVRGATTVRIGATTISAGKVAVTSATRLSVKTPAHAAGRVWVSVRTPGGTSAARAYVYRRAPRLARVSPARGSRTGGRVITLTGARFVAGHTGVRIGGSTLRATEVEVVSTSKLRFTTPAHAPGRVGVSVFTVGGASASKSFRYVRGAARTPRVSGFHASTGSTTSGGQRLTITGSGFVPASTAVRFGARSVGAGAVTVVSPNRLWVLTPPHSAGRVSIRVAVAGHPSKAIGYRYVRPGATPAARLRLTSPHRGVTASSAAPFVGGKGTAGATVSVLVDGVAYCRARVVASGRWACAGTPPLLQGAHAVRARQAARGHSASRLTGAVSIRIK